MSRLLADIMCTRLQRGHDTLISMHKEPIQLLHRVRSVIEPSIARRRVRLDLALLINGREWLAVEFITVILRMVRKCVADGRGEGPQAVLPDRAEPSEGPEVTLIPAQIACRQRLDHDLSRTSVTFPLKTRALKSSLGA